MIQPIHHNININSSTIHFYIHCIVHHPKSCQKHLTTTICITLPYMLHNNPLIKCLSIATRLYTLFCVNPYTLRFAYNLFCNNLRTYPYIFFLFALFNLPYHHIILLHKIIYMIINQCLMHNITPIKQNNPYIHSVVISCKWPSKPSSNNTFIQPSYVAMTNKTMTCIINCRRLCRDHYKI